MSETLEQECERLRREMHDAPLNKVFQDHNGHRHLGTHSSAWARKSREWCESVTKLEAVRAAYLSHPHHSEPVEAKS